MTGLVPGGVPRLLAPFLGGMVLGVVFEVAEPEARLYVLVSPALLAGLVGVLGTVVVGALGVFRRRWAVAIDAAVGEAVAKAAGDRLRFLMRLDHELKNPLTAIRAGLANIEQAGVVVTAEASAGAALASVSGQADRIARLVGDLRKLADLETREVEAAAVDLPAVLREVVEAAGAVPLASERVIRVNVPRAPWPLPLVEGDRDLLFIALQNLVANAVKFSAPGDAVEVRASEDGDWVLVEVADTGAGIAEDEIGEVWHELARGRAARSVPGTGIGLALVRVVVARHGGRVAIRSREGQGTVVGIRLPVQGRAGTAPVVAVLRQRRDSRGKARA